jgi:hypothetical protein
MAPKKKAATKSKGRVSTKKKAPARAKRATKKAPPKKAPARKAAPKKKAAAPRQPDEEEEPLVRGESMHDEEMLERASKRLAANGDKDADSGF